MSPDPATENDGPAPAPIPPPMPEMTSNPAPTVPIHHQELHQAAAFNTRGTLIAFVVAFAAIGGYLLFHSFASSVSDELNLVKAFQNLNKHRPSSIASTATVGWSKTKLFGTATLSATTAIDQYGYTDSTGSLTVSTLDTLQHSTAIKPKVFPYEIRTFGSAGTAFKVSNSASFASVLPHGSSLRNWLAKNPSALSRLDNNWYWEYSDGQGAGQASNANNVGCLDNTALLPSSSDLSSFAYAYGKKNPLTITASKSKSSTIYYISANKNDSAFARSISNNSYIKAINECAQLISHSTATDKLVGALNSNSWEIVVTVGSGNQISDIAFNLNQKGGGSGSSGRASAYVDAKFTYKSFAKDVVWPNGGDFPAYYYHLNHPKLTGLNNLRFKIRNLPSGWGADYCYSPWSNSNYQTLSLYPNGATGPYCGSSGFSTSSVSISAYLYTYQVSPEATSLNSSSSKFTANRSADAKKQAQATFNNKSPVLRQIQTAKSKALKIRCTPDRTVYDSVVVAGLSLVKVTRAQTTYGNCDPGIAKGSLEIDYYYYNTVFTNHNKTETDGGFDATYFRSPGDVDQSAAFDNLVLHNLTLKL